MEHWRTEEVRVSVVRSQCGSSSMFTNHEDALRTHGILRAIQEVKFSRRVGVTERQWHFVNLNAYNRLSVL